MVPMLNIPILSVVLMLLAGILIGHLIWYRDRSDDEAALVGLRGENTDLQAALHDHKKAYHALEAELNGQRKDSERLKSTNQDLEHTCQEIEHERALLSAELARLQQLKDQAFHDLDQERQQRRELQEALPQAEEQMAQLRAAAEQLQQQVASFHAEREELEQAAQAKLQQQDTTVEQLALERDAAQQEVKEHQDLLARLEAELHAREEDLHSLREERDELTAEMEEKRAVHEQMHRKVSQIDHLVTQRDEAMTRATSAEDHNRLLREDLVSHQQTHEHLMQEHAELVASHAALRRELMVEKEEHESAALMLNDQRERLAERETHIEALAQTQQELQSLRQELAAAQRSLGEQRDSAQSLAAELAVAREEIVREQQAFSELQASTDAISTQNQHLREQAEAWMALRGEHESIKRMLEDKSCELNVLLKEHQASVEAGVQSASTIAALQQDVESLRSAHAEQEDELDSLRSQLADYAETKRSLDEQSERLENVTAQRDEAVRVQATLKDIEGHLRTELDSQSVAFRSLSQQHEELRQELAAETEKSAQTAASLEEQAQAVLRLQEELRQQESWRHKHFELQTRFQENAQRLQHVMAERDECLVGCQHAEHRIQQLESKTRASEETIRHLRRERGAILNRGRTPAAIPFTSHPAASSEAEATGGRVRRDEVLGLVYTQPPKRKDDLKRISGIAQLLEKKLNAFGVYTYRQIMEWDSVAVDEFSKLLSFRDRIQRDDWVGQARNLYHEHYGRAA